MKLISILASIGLLWSVPALSAESLLPQDDFKDFKCQKELETEVKNVFGKNMPQWNRVIDPNFDTHAYRSPTEKVGEWYELHIVEKKTPKLTFVSVAKVTEQTWTDSCKSRKKESKGLVLIDGKKSGEETFSDENLAQLLKSSKSGVLYVWSPRMVYSVTEFTRFREVIEKKGLAFTPILDSAVEVSEAEAALQKAGVDIKFKLASNARTPQSVNLYTRLDSVDLYMRNASYHFPTVFVYANGKIHSRRLIGVLTNKGLSEALDQWLGELK